MKLVEILAREYEWDVLEYRILVQDASGCVFTQSGRYPCGIFELADDWRTEEVTHAQWKAERERILEKSSRFTEEDKANIERARIAANQKATQEAREIARTGSMTSEEQELADIACGKRSKEDQELWDKVALNAFGGVVSSEFFHHSRKFQGEEDCAAIFAFNSADAFMAEREKRMK